MEIMTKMRGAEETPPLNILLAIVFDPESKKILVAKRKNETLTGSNWCFPGGKVSFHEDLEKELKGKIKSKIGYEIESLGSVFANAYNGERDMMAVYYLCEVVGGKENLCDQFDETRWVYPEEIENYFRKELHPHLKEYLLNIK